jgi:prevent-host-death family protein
MSSILPISDLRNYNEVLKNCGEGEPVFLTKNGRGRYVVMDIEDYNQVQAERKLIAKLKEAESAIKTGQEWMSLEEVKKAVEE